jgi:hypothetical protein
VSISTVTVTLRDGNNQPVAGKVVTLASSRGVTDTITTLSGTTNASGQATFTVKSSIAGTSTYTATDTTDSNLSIPGTSPANQVIFGGANATTSTLIASPTTVQANGSSFSTLVVTLKDGSGNPVAGKVVTIVSSRGVTDTLTTVSGTTNAAGQATFTTKSAIVGTSVYTATDTTDSPQVVVTQTATVSFVCVTGSAAPIETGADTFIKIDFTNATGITRRLNSLVITWPNTPATRTLTSVTLQGITAWTSVGVNTSPMTINGSSTPAWDPAGNRTLNNGFIKTLKINYNFAVPGTGNYIVTATWDDNVGGSICTTPAITKSP